MADRVDRGTLYMTGGALSGAVALALAFSPHTASVFIAGVLIYNSVAGLCYAAFSALGLQLVGTRNPTASTQLALFAAASNAAVVYMTWADGQGYRMFGIRGLFLVDGIAAIGAAIPLLIFLRWRAEVGADPDVATQEA
jgi:predicted MFS family arabinose efflux permease